jgi:biotin carboxyl carrier protein
MKREVRVNNKIYQVEYEKTADLIRVSVDDRCYLVDVSAVDSNFFSFLVNNQSYDAFVGRDKDSFSVVLAGKTLDVAFYDPRSRQSSDEGRPATVSSRQIVCSPMAGRIVRFRVEKGDMVKDGQGLVVLEAMKMENELKSQGIGQVKEILVDENDVVVPGQYLLIIE